METHTHIKEEESSKEKEIRKIREFHKRWLVFWENYPKKVGKEKAGKAFKALPMYKQKEAISDNAADRYKNRKICKPCQKLIGILQHLCKHLKLVKNSIKALGYLWIK